MSEFRDYDSWLSRQPDLGEQMCSHTDPSCEHVVAEHLPSEVSCDEADSSSPSCLTCDSNMEPKSMTLEAHIDQLRDLLVAIARLDESEVCRDDHHSAVSSDCLDEVLRLAGLAASAGLDTVNDLIASVKRSTEDEPTF